jgi:hypothetical protein
MMVTRDEIWGGLDSFVRAWSRLNGRLRFLDANSSWIAPWSKESTKANLEKLARAMLKYDEDHGHLPANAIYSKQGKPLLSWRVELLPYLDQKNLYDRFKLDEPWDSPHNVKLIWQMPDVFSGKGTNWVGDHQATRFRVFSGKGAAFEGTEGIPLKDFTDGAATTILIVEANRLVPWTKPDLLPYLPDRPIPRLGEKEDGFHAAFADGSVRFLKEPDEKTLRALITRNGGEKVKLP